MVERLVDRMISLEESEDWVCGLGWEEPTYCLSSLDRVATPHSLLPHTYPSSFLLLGLIPCLTLGPRLPFFSRIKSGPFFIISPRLIWWPPCFPAARSWAVLSSLASACVLMQCFLLFLRIGWLIPANCITASVILSYFISGFVNRVGHCPLHSCSKNNPGVFIFPTVLPRVGGISQSQGKVRQEGSCSPCLPCFSQRCCCSFPHHPRMNLGSHLWLSPSSLSINRLLLSLDVSPLNPSLLLSLYCVLVIASCVSLSLSLCQSISPPADRLIFVEHLFYHVIPFIRMQQASFQLDGFYLWMRDRITCSGEELSLSFWTLHICRMFPFWHFARPV